MNKIDKINSGYFEKLKKNYDILIIFLNLYVKILNDR